MRVLLASWLSVAVLSGAAAGGDVFSPHLLYNSAVISNLSGGVKSGSVMAGAGHLQLLIDGDALAGVSGLSGFIDGLGAYGGAPDALIGDALGVSNIAAPAAARVYEAWLQYSGPRFSLLAGRYDLNSEFYRLSSAQLFLNSAFGIGPEFAQSGVASPSIFPDTSLALRLACKPWDNVVLRTALVEDRAPDQTGPRSVMAMGEVAILDRPAASMPPGESHTKVGRNAGLPAYDNKIAIGGWYDFGASPDQSLPGVNRHAGGAYVLADHKLMQMGEGKLAGFVQAGVADGRAGRFGFYLGAGLTAVGIVPSRPDDELGIAFARAQNGAHFSRLEQSLPGAEEAETSVEATYLAQLSSWLAVQPDLQWVLDPNSHAGHALVFQFEAEVSL
jgi:Carbohydrate-selective porin